MLREGILEIFLRHRALALQQRTHIFQKLKINFCGKVLSVAMESRKTRCPGCRRASCGECGIFQKLNTNKSVRISFPESFKFQPQEGLGISFDVGTTSLAGMLWNLENGTLLSAETDTNPQAPFGVDVVSRIQAAMDEKENLVKMQKLLVERLDEIAKRLLKEAAPQKGKVRKVTIAGNTAMCEILLGILPEGLFKAPFRQDYNEVIVEKGSCLGFGFLENAQVIVLPPIGGYVGADALMVYSYVNLKEPAKRILAVDIGTNGEILLQCGKDKFACSAAAGPALEGGAVSQGMRAVKGALDMVALSGSFPMQDIAVRVIGGGKGVGICGSGLVDAIALLYRIGVLDHTGYMRSAQEAKMAGVPGRICNRIIENSDAGGERRFLLTDVLQPVSLTSGDIRQLQLSISAIRSGMEILLRKAGCQVEELDFIYLAGGFGYYIGIESGIQIGLFPDIAREKYIQAGNLAGMGAAMALLSPKMREEMNKEKEQLVHVELAVEPLFQKLFLEHMNFPLQIQKVMV